MLAILVVGSLGAGYFMGSRNRLTITTTSVESSTFSTVVTSYVSTYCTISGAPGGISVRFLSDILSNTTSMPIAGIYVVAVAKPFFCASLGGLQPTGPQTITEFTTNATEWYPLPNNPTASFSIAAIYQGHAYNFTADLRPVSLTCATLYVPSGQTNVTITEFGMTCGS